MKLKIVQAVKLGTVACLLAVSCQAIGADYKPEINNGDSAEKNVAQNCNRTKVTKIHEVINSTHSFTTIKNYTCPTKTAYPIPYTGRSIEERKIEKDTDMGREIGGESIYPSPRSE